MVSEVFVENKNLKKLLALHNHNVNANDSITFNSNFECHSLIFLLPLEEKFYSADSKRFKLPLTFLDHTCLSLDYIALNPSSWLLTFNIALNPSSWCYLFPLYIFLWNVQYFIHLYKCHISIDTIHFNNH
jgi:hypothetical protein